MKLVHFCVHRFTTNLEELDEQALARLSAGGADWADWLCGLDEIEGALVIGEASILDDLASAIQRLCFEGVEALVVPGASYAYPYFTSNTQAMLVSSLDGRTIRLSGGDIPTLEFSHDCLLPALYACGERYLGFLEELGRYGRASSKAELAHLRPFAERALAALKAHGFTATSSQVPPAAGNHP